MSEVTAPKQTTTSEVLSKLVDRLDAMAPVAAPSTGRRDWKRAPIPDKCPPGMAIITDQYGAGRKMIHLLMLMDHAQQVIPTEKQFGGRAMVTGQLVDKANANQLIVEQYCPYPPGHIRKGTGRLFQHKGYIVRDGVMFHPNHMEK